LAAMRAVAFVDLDRTLLRGASGPALTQALRDRGVVDGSPLPGEGLVYRVFDLVGETLPSIMLARQAARYAKGWKQSDVVEAGKVAAEHLVAAVQPFAHPLVAEHRAAGRRVVLATTTPHDLIRPLADLLELDDVVATRYGLDGSGCYDGTVDGEFVWGRGKLRAVRAWAADNDVDLSESWAYSDSFYDAPLLGAVGHPVATNPDPRLFGLALLRRWPISHLDVPEGVPKLPVLNLEPQKLLLGVVRPELMPWVNLDVEGIDHIPAEGPAIVVANHRSYFDPLALGMAYARRGRPVRFLAKRELFDAPVVGQLVRAMGGIKVDRVAAGGDGAAGHDAAGGDGAAGHVAAGGDGAARRGGASDDPLVAAAGALAAGELVAVLPQGTIPRGPDFFDPELKGRTGAARLAAMTGAPVIPFGLWGTEEVWPRSERVPRFWNVTAAPTVLVRGGPPVELKGKSHEADTRRIMKAIRKLLPAEARRPYEPTAEELARTYPAGHQPEVAADPSPHESTGPSGSAADPAAAPDTGP
jgi:putative phosphoserine phosphatase / 1-acylglycerol-3-phosphate O-acyltransferase